MYVSLRRKIGESFDNEYSLWCYLYIFILFRVISLFAIQFRYVVLDDLVKVDFITLCREGRREYITDEFHWVGEYIINKEN